VAQQPLANPAGLLKVAKAQTALGDHATPGKWSKGDADQEFCRELREICKNLRLTGLAKIDFKERLEDVAIPSGCKQKYENRKSEQLGCESTRNSAIQIKK
jgi:hypothetical protein